MSIPPSKDIPPARHVPPVRHESTEISLAEIENLQFVPAPRRPGLRLVGCLLLIAGLGGVGYWQRDRLAPVRAAIAQVDFANPFSNRDPEPSVGGQSVDEQSVDEQSAGEQSVRGGDTANDADKLLNHRRYQVAETDSLVPLNPNSGIRLQPDAQAAIADMIAAAKADGIPLGIISGFRTLEDQDYLYFDLKAERGESAQTRAEVSAPPGYSEHHTGYAVDFIDESQPDTFLEKSFETTAVFEWLEANAAFYNFEMSFPKDNAAELSYEPWHWRYVGNQESLELFYK